MKAKVIIYQNSSDKYVDIFTSDGGVATLHHNQEHMVTTYYQDRIVPGEEEDNTVDIWTKLSEGKVYMEDWESDQDPTDEMILDAIEWLFPGEEVEIEKFYM